MYGKNQKDLRITINNYKFVDVIFDTSDKLLGEFKVTNSEIYPRTRNLFQ